MATSAALGRGAMVVRAATAPLRVNALLAWFARLVGSALLSGSLPAALRSPVLLRLSVVIPPEARAVFHLASALAPLVTLAVPAPLVSFAWPVAVSNCAPP